MGSAAETLKAKGEWRGSPLRKKKEQEGYKEPFQGESLGGFATCGVGSGRSKGRGKEGASQQFRGSETASQGRQMGEQVLYLPSSNSAEQSCHQTLKGVIKAAAKPISEYSFGSFSPHQSQRTAWPSPAVCRAPAPGAGRSAALGDSGGRRWQLEPCKPLREKPRLPGSSGGTGAFLLPIAAPRAGRRDVRGDRPKQDLGRATEERGCPFLGAPGFGAHAAHPFPGQQACVASGCQASTEKSRCA